MDAMKESMGSLIKTPMTRSEACEILNIEDSEELASEPVDHVEVMERFDVLFDKNAAEKGGSFYLRSKIFFAKEHLMQDWPPELNVSQVMNEAGESASKEESKSEEKPPTADAAKED